MSDNLATVGSLLRYVPRNSSSYADERDEAVRDQLYFRTFKARPGRDLSHLWPNLRAADHRALRFFNIYGTRQGSLKSLNGSRSNLCVAHLEQSSAARL